MMVTLIGRAKRRSVESNGLSGSANITFSGDVNWIVYDSDGFANTVYNKDGDYNATSGEYVYLYQVVSTGNDQIHNFSVALGSVRRWITPGGSAPTAAK